MKSNLLALLGAAVGFVSSFLIAYKVKNRRRVISRSFGEIYDDNTVDFNDSVLFENKPEDNYYSSAEAYEDYAAFVYMPW